MILETNDAGKNKTAIYEIIRIIMEVKRVPHFGLVCRGRPGLGSTEKLV
jgi:hypothetical protein